MTTGNLREAFCPLCREAVKPGAVRCKHCHGDFRQSPAGVPFALQEGTSDERRRLSCAVLRGGTADERRHCPPAIIDTAPGNAGVGVWVLLEETEERDGTYCTYEYAGGLV